MASENLTSACFTGRTKLINAYMQDKALYIQRDKIEIIIWIHASEFYIH